MRNIPYFLYLYMRWLFASCFVFIIYACGTSGPEAETPTLLRSVTVEAKVRHVYDTINKLDSPVTATILVYAEEQDRTDSVNLIRVASTDSTGEVIFTYITKLGLSDYDYYFKVVNNSLGIKLYKFNTLPETRLRLEVKY